MSDEGAPDKTLTSTQPPPPPTSKSREFTPHDFVVALQDQFDSLRSDFSAQIGGVHTSFEKHAESEEQRQNEVVGSLKMIQKDIDGLVANYHRVNRDVGEHGQRIAALEGELSTINKRVAAIMSEIQSLKGTLG